ncbi:hypothetical protein KM043_017817 [Ampulex compressa]|nr:hypothetical protein KM043_017817 [Ampulex compressa]
MNGGPFSPAGLRPNSIPFFHVGPGTGGRRTEVPRGLFGTRTGGYGRSGDGGAEETEKCVEVGKEDGQEGGDKPVAVAGCEGRGPDIAEKKKEERPWGRRGEKTGRTTYTSDTRPNGVKGQAPAGGRVPSSFAYRGALTYFSRFVYYPELLIRNTGRRGPRFPNEGEYVGCLVNVLNA